MLVGSRCFCIIQPAPWPLLGYTRDMNVYDIYEDKTGNNYLLKSGFCWPGFFFAWLWTAIHGMNWIALAQLVFWFLCLAIGFSFWYNLNWLYLIKPLSDLSSISPHVFHGLAFIFWFFVLTIHFYIGVFGNNWRRTHCVQQGWTRKANVLASTQNAARKKVDSD
jgi:hypothetical protein